MSEEIEKTVLEYLESLPKDFKWVYGRQVFQKDVLVSRFKTDIEFRKFVIKEVMKTATDLFVRKKKK